MNKVSAWFNSVMAYIAPIITAVLIFVSDRILRKTYIWLGGILAYVVPALVMGAFLLLNGSQRPIIGAILWPIRLIKLLLGGG